MKVINREHIRDGFSYEEYRQLGIDLVAAGKTTGANQSEAYVGYSKLNNTRMDRLDKTVRISEELVKTIKTIKKRQFWVVLTEIWCGDAAQNLPVLAKIAGLNGNIRMAILLRDENPEVMDAYLTHGSRSIPRLIVLDENLDELFTWGPRPAGAQELMMEFKKSGKEDKSEILAEIQKWYNTDNTAALQKEILELLTNAAR